MTRRIVPDHNKQADFGCPICGKVILKDCCADPCPHTQFVWITGIGYLVDSAVAASSPDAILEPCGDLVQRMLPENATTYVRLLAGDPDDELAVNLVVAVAP